MRCEPLADSFAIDCSPGNGTRYRLIVTINAGCIRAVAWPDSFWSAGDFGPSGIGAEWLEHSGRLGQADAQAIAAILAARPWLEPETSSTPEPVCAECDGSEQCPVCRRYPGDCPECRGEGCDECNGEGCCPNCDGSGDCPDCQRPIEPEPPGRPVFGPPVPNPDPQVAIKWEK